MTLDPFKVFSEKTHTIIQQIMEGLLRLDPSGAIQPALAESWERVNPVTVRFHLRKGVSFHNGETFNAQAVKFSFEKYVSPDTHYPGFGFVNSIARVDIVDDYTVDVVTNFPDGLLLNRMAAFLHIVPPAYYVQVGSAGFSERPVGTGPFKFDKWVKKQKISLVKNPGYWEKDFPRMSSLEFVFIPFDAQYDALMNGNIDLLTEMPGTMTTSAMENPHTIVKKKDSLTISVVNFNTAAGRPLSDLRVRQALNYAVDQNDYIRYDLLGNGYPLVSIGAMGLTGKEPTLAPYPFDPARAKSLLAQAGYGPGKPLHLKLLTVPHAQRAVGILSRHLETVGVIAEVKIVPEVEIVPTLMKEPWDMAMASLPNPMAHIFFPACVMFYSRSPFSLLKSPEFDGMLEQAVATLDPAEQQEKFRKIDKYIHDQALGLFLYQRIKTFGVSRRVYFTPYVTGMPYFFDARTGVVNTSKTAQ